MEDSEWIDRKKRMPTEKDADAKKCILVWHKLNGAMITGWHHVADNRFLTHWAPCPKGPDGAEISPEDYGPTPFRLGIT